MSVKLGFRPSSLASARISPLMDWSCTTPFFKFLHHGSSNIFPDRCREMITKQNVSGAADISNCGVLVEEPIHRDTLGHLRWSTLNWNVLHDLICWNVMSPASGFVLEDCGILGGAALVEEVRRRALTLYNLTFNLLSASWLQRWHAQPPQILLSHFHRHDELCPTKLGANVNHLLS